MSAWHFPRKDFADYILDTLALGISSNIGLFAPRRKGKTAFLLNDLAPAAQERGYVPVYASLWQETNHPHRSLILALEEALESHSKRGAIVSLLSAKIRKTTISNDMLGKMELEFADDPKPATSEELIRIDVLLTQLEKAVGKKKILLLLDEAQHLATASQFEALTFALRTALDKRQGRVKGIFTGSSRHYMDLLFNKSASPMYNFVETIRFPELGTPFINWIANKTKNEFGVDVPTEQLAATFDRLDKSPFWMLRTVHRLLTIDPDLETAEAMVQELLIEAEGLPKIAEKMNQVDKIVFLSIVSGNSPYSEETLKSIEELTTNKPTTSTVQKALGRLKSANLISQAGRGDFLAEKPGLAAYLTKPDAKSELTGSDGPSM